MADESITELLQKHKYLADVIRLRVLGLNGWDTKAEVLSPVIDALSQPDGTENPLEKFLVLGVGSGAWAGMDNRIVTFDNPGWTAAAPNAAGDIVLASRPSNLYTFTGVDWILFSDSQGAPISDATPQSVAFDVDAPGVLSETSRADHTHRLVDPAVNPSPIAADATQDVGIDPTAARSDHQHALSTSTTQPSQVTSALGQAGGSVAVARADHSHAHGSLAGGSLHGLAGSSAPGFMSKEHFDKVEALAQPAIGRYTLSTDQTGLTNNEDVPLAIFVDDFVDAGLGLTRLNAFELRASAKQRYEINVQLYLLRTAGSGHQTLILGAKVKDAAALTNVRKLESIAPYTNTFVGASYNFQGVIELDVNEVLTVTVGNMTSSDTFAAKASGCWVDIKKI